MFSKYGSQACNFFFVNEAFYLFILFYLFIYFFWVGGSTPSRSKMQQMMQQSVSRILLRGKVDVQWQRYW
jgi:hypothetical protein